MMAQKVALGGRFDLRDMIMRTYDPAKMKALGGKDSLTNFSDSKALWVMSLKPMFEHTGLNGIADGFGLVFADGFAFFIHNLKH